MELTPEHRKKAEEAIVETVITALNHFTLTAGELPEVSRFILDGMVIVKTQEDLVAFLRTLSSKWHIFTHVLVVESGEIKERDEQRAYNSVLTLAKDNKIEEALQAAKSATKTL